MAPLLRKYAKGMVELDYALCFFKICRSRCRSFEGTASKPISERFHCAHSLCPLKLDAPCKLTFELHFMLKTTEPVFKGDDCVMIVGKLLNLKGPI